MSVQNLSVPGQSTYHNIYQTSLWLIGFLNIRKPWPSAPRTKPAQHVSSPLWTRSKSQMCLGKERHCPTLITSEWVSRRGLPRILAVAASRNFLRQCGLPRTAPVSLNQYCNRWKEIQPYPNSVSLPPKSVLFPMEKPESLFFNVQKKLTKDIENSRIHGGMFTSRITCFQVFFFL